VIVGNATRGRIVATSADEMPTGLGRLLALRRRVPEPGRALRFAGPAFWASFARSPVDVVFHDARGKVVGVAKSLKPWRSAGPFADAVGGIVIAPGASALVPVEVGDQLEITPTTGERMAAGAKPPLA